MERKLTAILSADVKGYSRLMGEDEEATIRTLTAYREVMATLIRQHRGRVVDSPGDNLLAEFASAVDALRCAVEVQHELRVRNTELPDHRKMEFRIGINVGDVIIEGERLYGDGVNIAARLEGLAERYDRDLKDIFALQDEITQRIVAALAVKLESGLYPTIDDIAKLITLLQHGGQHQGQQLLSASKLAEALYKAEAKGLPSRQENRFGEGRYHLSFWSVPYRTSNGCFFQIPYMAGYGGNFVVLLPNGISAFRFADGHNYDVDTMVLAGEALRPFPCPSGSGEAPPRERQPLSASEVGTELLGNTFYADPWNVFGIYDARLNLFVAADGVLYNTLNGGSDMGTWHDAGRWHVTPDGHFCSRGWNDRREHCAAVYQEGETFELHPTEGLGKMVFTRAPGNPEGY